MTESATEPPHYERFDTDAGFQAAIERLLEQPGRELRIFDPDLSALRLNEAARLERLERFLLASPTRRLYLAVHKTDYLSRRCPRMIGLLARLSHVIQVRRTQEEISELQDAFLVLDAAHFVRRPVAQFFRGIISLGDDAEALAMRERFGEIWDCSVPAVPGRTLGL
jgi:hypothetical protein